MPRFGRAPEVLAVAGSMESRVERTLIILKPDAVQRGLSGTILSRFEEKGLKLVAMKLMKIDRGLAERHYAPHKGKPFYPGLIDYVTSGPVVVLVLEGLNAIAVARKMMGATFGFNAEPGTIRGDWGLSKTFNLIHGSDAPESAAAEISLYFKPEEILGYERPIDRWVYDMSAGSPQ